MFTLFAVFILIVVGFFVVKSLEKQKLKSKKQSNKLADVTQLSYNRQAIEYLQLEKEVAETFLAAYPNLKIGERLETPVAVVRNGKIVRTNAHFTNPHNSNEILREIDFAKTISVLTYKFKYPLTIEDISDFAIIDDAEYMHIYNIQLHPLANKTVGEKLEIIDPESWEPKIVTVDEQFIEDNNYIRVRVAFS